MAYYDSLLSYHLTLRSLSPLDDNEPWLLSIYLITCGVDDLPSWSGNIVYVWLQILTVVLSFYNFSYSTSKPQSTRGATCFHRWGAGYRVLIVIQPEHQMQRICYMGGYPTIPVIIPFIAFFYNFKFTITLSAILLVQKDTGNWYTLIFHIEMHLIGHVGLVMNANKFIMKIQRHDPYTLIFEL